MKIFFRIVFTLYLLMLLWLVLFKLSADIFSVLATHPSHGLNLIPFADATSHVQEIIDNIIVFVPFGLFLSINFKKMPLARSAGYIAVFSFVIELLQFMFAIGVADVTDVIANTLGGLLGLGAYRVSDKFANTEVQDRFITLAVMMLLIFILFLRFFVLRVKY